MNKPCAECIRVEGWRGVGVPRTCLIPRLNSETIRPAVEHVRYNTRKARGMNGPCGSEGRHFWSIHQIGMPGDLNRNLPVVESVEPPDVWDYLGNVVE